MKVFKKLSLLFVAAAMMMTTVSTAFAAENSMKEENGSITITRDGAEYDAYKILDSKTKGTAKGDIAVYTVNEKFADFFIPAESKYTFVADEGILLDGVKVVSSDQLRGADSKKEYEQSPEMKALTKALIDYSIKNKIAPEYTQIGKETKTVKQGYYLVIENTNTISSNNNTGRVPSQAMLLKVEKGNDVNIYPKDSELTINKEIVGKGEVSVGGVGVEQEFKITSTVPTYADNFKKIEYNVIDTMSKGLTLNNESITVKVGEDVVIENGVVKKQEYLIDNKYTSVVDETKKITVTEFKFAYEALKSASKMGAPVVITYKAEINQDAVVYNENTNTAKLVYTTTQDGKNNAIEDETKTYTYGLDLVKKDGSNKDKTLKGATFEIKNKDGKVLETVTSDENGKISFTGLAEGTYTLTETKTPSSEYAVLDGPITFEITANEDKKSCTVTIVDGDASITSDATSTKGMISFEIYNYKGISLPETGGMGTTIFMVGGAALIALAGVMLVVYSKKSKKA